MRTNLVKPFSAWAVFSSLSLFALPTGSEVVSGQAEIQSKAHEMQIKTGDRAIVHWKEFSLGKGETLRFVQPSSKSAVLNRVKGSDASHIAGQLLANGRVYLVNPNGVIFTKDATVRTAEFLASTHDLTNEAFLQGKELLFQGDSGAHIINYGSIETDSGNITLIAQQIDNEGSLKAPQGAVSLAAGYEVLLKPEAISILSIRPGSLSHSGEIEALRVDLQTAGSAESYAMNLSGSILATNPVQTEGKIFLRAPGAYITSEAVLSAPQGTIQVETQGPLFNTGRLDVSGPQGGRICIEAGGLTQSGSLLAEGRDASGGHIQIETQGAYVETARGHLSVTGKTEGGAIDLTAHASLSSSGTHTSQGGKGGTISLLSPSLTLVSGTFDASGTTQGGSLFIGGGAHGQLRGPFNATTTHISGDTQLNASALAVGNAGTLVVWSDERTVCYGSILADGGNQGGNGGWIEVSSRGELHCNATLSAKAPLGLAGSVLLDPKNIIIDPVTGVFPQYQFINPIPGDTSFGTSTSGTPILPLTNGNVAICAPNAMAGTGSVYLFNGNTAALLSTWSGGAAGSTVGSAGLVQVGTSNYVISSPNAVIGGFPTGAATWVIGNGSTSGIIDFSNSLVGLTAGDQVGSGIVVSTGGNYVVTSPNWTDNTVPTSNVGAATWADGTIGVSGFISGSNSLIGSTANDQVSSVGVTFLANGNYVVGSPNWTNPSGPTASVGAATWGNGSGGTVGTVTTANSLVGSSAQDQVSSLGVVALPSNSNYVVSSPLWNGGMGAATWGNGLGGTAGAVSSANSLVGTTATSMAMSGDQVGSHIVVSTNGNYVSFTPTWTGGTPGASLGAVTWADGTMGVSGTVSGVPGPGGNSLVGFTQNDQVSLNGVTFLTDTIYVVASSQWTNPTGPIASVGAATWASGMTVGTVTLANSLVGSAGGDLVSSGGITALAINNNYVVSSPSWNSDIGAATWGNGAGGTTVGPITVGNSLIGLLPQDLVSSGGITPLTNGNYVVSSPAWEDNQGAATWGNGAGGTVGAVTVSNSLIGAVGGASGDQVSSGSITPLTNGNYVVASPHWSNGGTAANTGAVTWGNGSSGTSGFINSSLNSLIGAFSGDLVGTNVIALNNGNYVTSTPTYQTNHGIATWATGTSATVGIVGLLNSLVGGHSNDQVGSAIKAVGNNYLVSSPNWASTQGAVTWGDGTNGSVGLVNSANSLVGTNPGSSNPLTIASDTVNTFIVPFTQDAAVRVGLLAPNNITFGVYAPNALTATPSLFTIAPLFIQRVLNRGTAVTLEASNDITINSGSSITNGSSASLTLTAGRNVTINSSTISTVNGPISIIANAPAVINADRDPGLAALSITGSTITSTGTGALTLQLSNGTGNTNNASGDLIIGDNTTVQCSGTGALSVNVLNNASLIASTGNISLGDLSLLQTASGTLSLISAVPRANIVATGSATIQTVGNDLQIQLPINTTGNGTLTLSAGRNLLVPSITTAGGSVSLTANSPASSSRIPGTATLATTGNINTGTGNLTLLLSDAAGPSADIVINSNLQCSGTGTMNVTSLASDIELSGILQCGGSGMMTINAPANNVIVGNFAFLQTQNGNLQISAGQNIAFHHPADTFTIQTLGTGQLILICDALFPVPPSFGTGAMSFPRATLRTGGNKLLLYTSQRNLNTMPVIINNTPYIPGPLFVNSATEKWGTYYPNSSGIPFTIFYKNTGPTPPPPPPPPPPPSPPSPPSPPTPPSRHTIDKRNHAILIATAEPFQFWRNPWYSDVFFSGDIYPPFLTPKVEYIVLPSLVQPPPQPELTTWYDVKRRKKAAKMMQWRSAL